MPWYHPAVFHLAFRYLEGEQPTIRIEVVPRLDEQDPLDVNARLYRTCLALLETVYRYGRGISTNYRKRVHHDCLVSREEYQDLYLVMRERYKHLVGTWHENTDPLKHVFEVWTRDSEYNNINQGSIGYRNCYISNPSMATRFVC